MPAIRAISDECARLAKEIIKDFIAIDPETQPRNVSAWTPVVTDIIQGSVDFEEEAASRVAWPGVDCADGPTQFKTHVPSFYPLIIDILQRERAAEMRLAVRDYLARVGQIYQFGCGE